MLALGGTHCDVGQPDDASYVVMADPSGQPMCVIEAGNGGWRGRHRQLSAVRPRLADMAQIFSLDYPQSLAVYEHYTDAQKAVDHLSDNEFPVENVLIVGTELKQLERITGRLTWGRVIGSGAAGGAWFGLLFGLLLGLFASEDDSWIGVVLTGVGLGIVWGIIIGAVGYAMSGGRRDFSSVKTIEPSKYEVLVEHKHLARAQELLAQLPGATAW